MPSPMPSPMPALPDLPDPDLPDTSYRPFKVPHAAHVLALAEAKARAEELAVRPTATRFLLLRQDGTVTRQCDDLVEARAWQRALPRGHLGRWAADVVSVPDDGGVCAGGGGQVAGGDGCGGWRVSEVRVGWTQKKG
jgi:hypothetical protein